MFTFRFAKVLNVYQNCIEMSKKILWKRLFESFKGLRVDFGTCVWNFLSDTLK